MKDEPTTERFGPYELVSLLGRGGMGEVYRAYDTVRKRTVALKRLPRHLAGDPDYQVRFRREAEVAARLTEPHIIPIHDYGEIAGQLYIDMRLIVGADLAEVLKQSGPLPPARAVGIVGQVASALAAAHAEGLIHRDVKPSNVLISVTDRGEDFVHLVDFGIAREESSTVLTATGATIGTLDYMAPERIEQRDSDHRVDVYALGCVLYEALTATKPFPASGSGAKIFAHVYTPPPRPSAARPGIPPGLDDVVAIAMAKDPGRRYKGVTDLATSAHRCLDNAGLGRPPTEAGGHAASGAAASPAPPTRSPAPSTGTKAPSTRLPATPTRTPAPSTRLPATPTRSPATPTRTQETTPAAPRPLAPTRIGTSGVPGGFPSPGAVVHGDGQGAPSRAAASRPPHVPAPHPRAGTGNRRRTVLLVLGVLITTVAVVGVALLLAQTQSGSTPRSGTETGTITTPSGSTSSPTTRSTPRQATSAPIAGATSVITDADGRQTVLQTATLQLCSGEGLQLDGGQQIKTTQIERIDVTAVGTRDITLAIRLVGGQQVTGRLSGGCTVAGDSDIGPFQLTLDKLQSVEIRR